MDAREINPFSFGMNRSSYSGNLRLCDLCEKLDFNTQCFGQPLHYKGQSLDISQ